VFDPSSYSNPAVFWLLMAIGSVVSLALLAWGIGLVTIGEDQVGIVTKGFSFKSLPSGRIVALEGEAGIQVDTLAPGWHFFLWPWQYSVEKVPMLHVPEGEIALVIANDGDAMEHGRTLCDPVACDNYQNGRAFLKGGGRKGRQLAKLQAGYYRINTKLFTIVDSRNGDKHGVNGAALRVLRIGANKIGIVTTHDGRALNSGEIAATPVTGHGSFQDEQAYIKAGGYRGLQQEVILPGTWNINPWFASVEVVDMTEIPVAHVGVVVSYVGVVTADVSGEHFKYGDIVVNGSRGVWAKPLNPGMYPINLRTTKVELVPTSNFVLNWAHKTEAHGLDRELSSITMRSRDGFSFTMDVQQIIHVPYDVAPKLIARFGNMVNLVQNVLEPLIGNYFRNAGQSHDMLEFISTRTDRQGTARKYVTEALRQYDVEGVDTLIGDINPPESLMKTLQDRKIAEESRQTITMQMEMEKKRQEKERETAIADSQRSVVESEQQVRIAERNAEAAKKRAEGEANVAREKAMGEADALKTRTVAEANAKTVSAQGEATALKTRAEAEANARTVTAKAEGEALKLKADNEATSIKMMAEANSERIQREGAAQAAVLLQKAQAIGTTNYAAIEVAKALATSDLKLVPDIQLAGAGGGSAADALLAYLALGRDPQKPATAPLAVPPPSQI